MAHGKTTERRKRTRRAREGGAVAGEDVADQSARAALSSEAKAIADKASSPAALSDEQLGCIAACIEAGIPEASIAKALGISEGRLERHAAMVEGDARKVALAKVVSNLFVLATTPDPKCTTAAIFYLKCRGKWREPDAKVADSRTINDASELTNDELVAEIVRRNARARMADSEVGEVEPSSVH